MPSSSLKVRLENSLQNLEELKARISVYKEKQRGLLLFTRMCGKKLCRVATKRKQPFLGSPQFYSVTRITRNKKYPFSGPHTVFIHLIRSTRSQKDPCGRNDN